MDWNNVLWALLAALVVALVATAMTWVRGIRRKRVHAALVRDAVAQMCAQRPEHPGRLTRLTRDVLDVLVRQEEGAGLLDSGERPEDAERLVSIDADLALLVAADGATTPRVVRRRNVSDDSAWQQPGEAPKATDHPELAEIRDRLRRIAERRIVRARLVLDQADRISEPENAECRARLKTTFDRSAEELHEADELAAAGRVLASLHVIANLDLPVAEDGVPGQADLPELQRQTNALARFALRHRAALDSHREVVTVLLPEERR